MPDLKQELQALADRRSAESSADFEAVLTTAGARRRRRTAISAAVTAVVAVAAVVSFTPWRHLDTAPAPTSTLSPVPGPTSAIKISPGTVRPGQTVALTFPEKDFRGIGFTLALETEPGKVLYYLRSDRPSGEPTWRAAGDGTLGGPDIGIGDGGPDRVVVPATAAVGTYRLCTESTNRQVCGLLTVRG